MADSSFAFLPSPHSEAARFIRAKPAVTRAVFDAMLPELKARAFVISGIEQLETMQKVREKLSTLPEGTDWEKTKAEVSDLLTDLGDGAENRAEVLLRTHVFQAYAAMEHRILAEERDIFPYLKYKTMGDEKVRDSHAALDGLILPADDPFWQDHTPPWDWGCRCLVIPMTREEVEGIKEREADLPPEQRTVIDGDSPARLARLRSGHLDRQLPSSDPRNAGRDGEDGRAGLKQLGRNQTWDVQSDFQRGREGALKWNPGDLRIDLTEIKKRYADSPDLWAQFEAAMRRHKVEELPGQPTVWEWLVEKQPEWERKVEAQTRNSALARIEAGIRRKTSGEVAVAIGQDGVNYAVKEVGGRTMELTRDELQQFAGKTGLHNHPASSAFSPADLRSFADSGAVEWRVVGPRTTFILRRPPGGWPADVHEKIDRLEKTYFARAAKRERFGHPRQELDKWAVHHIGRAWAEQTGASFQFIAEGL